MAWGKNPWYSPKSIKEPVRTITPSREVVAVPIGQNSVRYEARSVMQTTSNRVNSKYERKKGKYKSWRDLDDDEGYIDSDFGTKNPKPKYAWTPTRWSSFNFNTYTVYDSDDNSTLCVKEIETYLTPTSAEIKSKTGLWSGEDTRRIKELARVCYLKMIDDRDYMSDRFKDPNTCGLSSKDWDEKKTLFESVYDTYIPGFTPLEQAIAVNYQYMDKIARARQSKGKQGRQITAKANFDRNDYADPFLNGQLDMNNYSKKRKLQILNCISIIGDMGSQFKVEKETGEREVANSPYLKKKVMRDYDQLRMVGVYQRLLPNFRTKFLTKDLMIDVPVQTSERKQKIIIICDFSGSMNDEEKQIWVNALLIDRFRYVMKGEAEIYFSFFVSNPSQLHFKHIKNEEDVKQFWKSHDNFPNGSLTDMGRIVSYIKDQIDSKRLHNLDIDLSQERPEILIINDGQDSVGQESFPYKVNAVSLMDFSDELKSLCKKSGGKQIQITRDHRIFSYATGESKKEITKTY